MRSLWRDAVRLVVVALGALLLAACSDEPKTGPVAVKYGRDTCEYCRMVITDPRFAAQVRGGPEHKAHKFDDIGEGVAWLDMQPWKDETNVEIWVMDMTTGKSWLDARRAFFVPVRMSPMGSNHGAVAEVRAGAITFEEFRKTVRKNAAAILCRPAVTAAEERAR